VKSSMFKTFERIVNDHIACGSMGNRITRKLTEVWINDRSIPVWRYESNIMMINTGTELMHAVDSYLLHYRTFKYGDEFAQTMKILEALD
jgi:hypothetical protein